MPGLRMWSLLVLLTACDARIAAGPSNPTAIDAPAGAADPDATMTPPDAAPLGPWSAPAKITVAAVHGQDEDDETLSSTGLEMFYAIVNKAQSNQKELFYT